MKSNLEYIDDYFAELLPTSEKETFNIRIKNDDEFAKEVALYLQAKKLGHLEKKKQFYDLNKSLNKQPLLSVVKGLGAITAAAILIIGLWTLFFNNTQTPKEYAQNYINEKLISLDTEMSVSQDSLSKAVELYNKKKYSEALTQLKNIQNPLALEYQGLCYLQLNQYIFALESFKKLSANNDILQNKGYFYQALVLIEMGKQADANVILRKIETKPNAFGKVEAFELSKLIEE
jgi:hypothetical protein